MAAGKYNFVIEQGTTLSFEIAYTDSNDDAIDLTHYSGKMQIKDKIGGTSLITLSSSRADDGTGLNFNGSGDSGTPTDGKIGVFISAYSSSLLDFNKAVYDLEITSGSNYPVVTRLLQGNVSLDKEVTTD